MIEYKEIQTDSKVYNCTSSCLATLCEEKGAECDLMFLDCWDFKWNHDTSGIIGGTMDRNFVHYFDALRNYHNINVQIDLIDSIEMLLEKIRYYEKRGGCAIGYDTFYCPWVYNYQIDHQNHFSLVLGVQNEELIVCDTVPYSEHTSISLKQVFQGRVYLMTISILHEQTNLVDFGEKIYGIAVKNLSPNSGISQLREYAGRIKSDFCVERENLYVGTNSWVRAPFLVDLETIVRSRRDFSISLEYLRDHSEKFKKLFSETINTFKSIADTWYIVFLSSWRIFLEPHYDDSEAKNYLSSSINQLANEEQNLAKQLIKIMRG